MMMMMMFSPCIQERLLLLPLSTSSVSSSSLAPPLPFCHFYASISFFLLFFTVISTTVTPSYLLSVPPLCHHLTAISFFHLLSPLSAPFMPPPPLQHFTVLLSPYFSSSTSSLSSPSGGVSGLVFSIRTAPPGSPLSSILFPLSLWRWQPPPLLLHKPLSPGPGNTSRLLRPVVTVTLVTADVWWAESVFYAV